jgi:hypothetical protein
VAELIRVELATEVFMPLRHSTMGQHGPIWSIGKIDDVLLPRSALRDAKDYMSYERAKDEWEGMAARYKAEALTPDWIVVPATGAPTRRGVALTVRPLTTWAKDTDLATEDDLIRVQADRARCDGYVLYLRPTADHPAHVSISSAAFAAASLQDDFADRALVVDPDR